jgi:hypothetical protein
MHVSTFVVVFSLSGAMGACVEVPDEDSPDIASAEQAIFHNEVRVRKIQAVVLEEGGDEIYLTASQSDGGGVNIIRPPGDPDYWRFDEPDGRVINPPVGQHVGTIVPGSLLIVNLWEQDGGPHDEIGTIDFELDHTGEPRTFDTPTGHFLGIDANGMFMVRFTNGANYKVWFQVGP